MTSVAMAPQTQAPHTRKWTKAEYYRMAELGWFRGQRVELIEGEIVVLSPQNVGHFTTTDRATEVQRVAFGPGYWVRMQGPLDLGDPTEPEPDVSVVLGSRDDYTGHPTTAVLIVEVSDSSLSYDRNRKASLYARAGIADYWIVNLVDAQVEVYRQPTADPTAHHGFAYADETIVPATGTLFPLAAPTVTIPAADLLPRSSES